LDPQFFNSMTTMHALLMIFGAVMRRGRDGKLDDSDAIGAPDMALRASTLQFLILPFAFTLLLSSLFVPAGRPRALGPCTRRLCCRPGILPRC